MVCYLPGHGQPARFHIQVYVSYLKPLEWTMNHEEHNGHPVREDNSVFCKLITHTAEQERVVGVHYVGPNAGEIIQVC